MKPLLSIKNLTVAVNANKILDDISWDVAQGKITGIVGGSGSGKTTLGLSILRLLPPAMRADGQILFMGEDLTVLTEKQMRQFRGGQAGMVFQEPQSAFDPLFTIGDQLDETLMAHMGTRTETVHVPGMSPRVRYDHIMDTLRSVEIEDPLRIFRSYPHQLSGGLRQRAMIALAIVCNPQLVIADEPTSSLDVTIQAKIMRLLRKLNCERGMTIILITHDLDMIGHLADEIAVMSEGKIVESGTPANILRAPRHAYTKALLEAY